MQGFTQVQELTFLTARLLRLNTFNQLARGEAQLRAAGIEVPITDVYAKHAKTEIRRYTAPKAEESLIVVNDKSKL